MMASVKTPSPTHALMTRPVITCRELNTIAHFYEKLRAILDNSCFQLDIWNHKRTQRAIATVRAAWKG